MDLGQTQRPRAEVREYEDFEPRSKCSICCGLRCAAVSGGFVMAIALPCNIVMLGGKVLDGAGVRGFINRHAFLALPVAAITFTHQLILSESLWSKNRKTVATINLQSTLSNITLWSGIIAISTLLSRRVLPQRSRSYRLLLWEYTRTRRGCANPWVPSVFGRITEDLDWYQMLWALSTYHLMWAMVAVMLEKEMGAHYAMLYRSWSYSKWCSPRWREWREVEVARKVQTEHVVAPSRWGNFISNDRWRARGD